MLELRTDPGIPPRLRRDGPAFGVIRPAVGSSPTLGRSTGTDRSTGTGNFSSDNSGWGTLVLAPVPLFLGVVLDFRLVAIRCLLLC
ncbi:hypothetical protein GCM10027280_47760 [Micromonospora polyrhachis]